MPDYTDTLKLIGAYLGSAAILETEMNRYPSPEYGIVQNWIMSDLYLAQYHLERLYGVDNVPNLGDNYRLARIANYGR